MKKSILVLAMISFFTVTILFFGGVSAASGESDNPDQSRILAADDGDPDGCNSSRFECVMGGEAVLDKQTGLTWTRNANMADGPKPWQEAMEFCQNLVIGNQKGWRLPTKEELSVMLILPGAGAALPDGHPFKRVQEEGGTYWSSTTYESDSSQAWLVRPYGYSSVYCDDKVFDSYVWPVLGGN